MNLLRLVGLKGTIAILRLLSEHSLQYKHLRKLMDTCTLNKRVKQLSDCNLVTHHTDKKSVRKEWYEITDKGIEVLQILEDIVQLIGVLDIAPEDGDHEDNHY